MAIRGERTGTEELIKDGLFLWAALLKRSEYLHDDLQRECELDVYKRVKKNRPDAAYRSVYPSGLSGLIMLTGRAQERAVQAMVTALEAAHPDLSKQYQKSLLELAQKASLAEEEWEAADAKAGQAFQRERLQRAGLVRI